MELSEEKTGKDSLCNYVHNMGCDKLHGGCRFIKRNTMSKDNNEVCGTGVRQHNGPMRPRPGCENSDQWLTVQF